VQDRLLLLTGVLCGSGTAFIKKMAREKQFYEKRNDDADEKSAALATQLWLRHSQHLLKGSTLKGL